MVRPAAALVTLGAFLGTFVAGLPCTLSNASKKYSGSLLTIRLTLRTRGLASKGTAAWPNENSVGYDEEVRAASAAEVLGTPQQ
jgi:hypothetical protein